MAIRSDFVSGLNEKDQQSVKHIAKTNRWLFELVINYLKTRLAANTKALYSMEAEGKADFVTRQAKLVGYGNALKSMIELFEGFLE